MERRFNTIAGALGHRTFVYDGGMFLCECGAEMRDRDDLADHHRRTAYFDDHGNARTTSVDQVAA